MAKSAMVTGGSEGIGKAFAIRLAKEGYDVTVTARNETKLKELVAQLGPSHSYFVADLATEEGQNEVLRTIQESTFNLFINNAGIGTVGAFTNIALEKQMSMFSLNCEALVKFSYVYLKHAKSGDALINVSSALAFMPTPSMALYCATKSFVTTLSESLWYEQKEKGVYVMGLCPGITETNFQINAGGRREDLPKNLSQTPEVVVEQAMQALKLRCKPTVFTGMKNILFASTSRFLSRKATVSLTGKMMP